MSSTNSFIFQEDRSHIVLLSTGKHTHYTRISIISLYEGFEEILRISFLYLNVFII